MRYDTKVYFQKTIPGEYNPLTGNYSEDTTAEELKYAAVSSTSIEMLKLVYGNIKEESLTIHLQNPYKKEYDHIRIGDKIYKVDYIRNLRTKQILIAKEVQ